MHEVNLVSLNVWRFGEQRAGLGPHSRSSVLCLGNDRGGGVQGTALQTKALHSRPATRGGALLAWVCFHLKLERFPKTFISLFLYSLLTQ